MFVLVLNLQKYYIRHCVIYFYYFNSQVHQRDIDDFGNIQCVNIPCCSVRVRPTDKSAVSSLYYGIPVDGILDPLTLYIDRNLEDFQQLKGISESQSID